MMLFWILVTAMVAMAVSFVVVPMLRHKHSVSTSRDELNIAVIKQQLAELQADLDNGKLEREAFEAARIDLEKELLYDVCEANGAVVRVSAKRGRWAAGVLAVAIPVTAVLLYQQLGSSKLIALAQSQANIEQAQDQEPSVAEMVERLAQRLQQRPEDLKGWQMLARSYYVLQRYGAAAEAYARAAALDGGKDPDILAGYAEALALAHDGRLAGKPSELLAKALALQPRNPRALWLNGYRYYQGGDYRKAIRQWELLAQLVPADSQEAAQIQQGIQDARAQLREPATATPEPAQAAPPAARSKAKAPVKDKAIQVKVALADDLKNEVSSDNTVFIFARAVNGPRMPLAVVRKRVSELPATLTLDDASAISPQLTLSGFSEVVLEARVSKSGNAIAQSGDLRGAVKPVTPGQVEVVELTIDSVVP